MVREAVIMRMKEVMEKEQKKYPGSLEVEEALEFLRSLKADSD